MNHTEVSPLAIFLIYFQRENECSNNFLGFVSLEAIEITQSLFSDKKIVKQMPLNRKKYLITTEKHEVIIVQNERTQVFYKYCAECKKDVEILTLDAVTSKTGQRTREVFQLIENNLLHSIETESGHLLVCRNSLEAIDTQKLIKK